MAPRKAPVRYTLSVSPPRSKNERASSPAHSSPLTSPELEDKPKVEGEDTKPSALTLSASAKKKLSLYENTLKAGTPFPHWPHPTREEAQLVADRLASVHGMPTRPEILVDKPGAPAGCGATPSVLDALVRTILSQNTTSKNSTRAKLSMDDAYGRAKYRRVLKGGADKLEEVIRCGGLAGQKSKSIIGVLKRCDERQRNEGKGEEELSLDWLHKESDKDAMKELISYDMVGIKTASCVLLFCLGRSSFAVDTHVHRLTQSLGWLPPTGSVHTVAPDSDLKNPTYVSSSKTTTAPSRDQTFYHLDATLPDELKYPLHSLLVRHGRGCVKCAANGVTTQDIVDTCPIEDLIVRGKGGKRKGGKAKKVKVEDEEGKVVGSIKEDEDGEIKVEVKDEVEGEIGERNKTKEEEDGEGGQVKVEDEVNQTRRSPRKRKAAQVKEESSEEEESEEEEEGDEEEEYQSEEDVKPAAKRQRTKRTPTASPKKKATPKKATPKATPKKGKQSMEHSVDRDEAEMSGRSWKKHEGAMHGLDG